MSTILDEIEAMILAGNQRMAQREELTKSAILKADDVYSAMKKPSVILKKTGTRKLIEKKAEIKKPEIKVITDILTCNNCGKSTKPGDIFCAGCGGKVAKSASPEIIEIPLICSCGRPLRERTLFCGACGAKRPVVEITDRICPKGHINTPDSGFCFICGEKIP